MEFPLNESQGNFYTVKFESETEKDKLRNDKKELSEGTIQEHKISGTFDFAKVTEDELLNTFLCSTTSVLKAYQNNVLKGMTEPEILEMAKHHQKVSVRELLDGRSSKILTDAELRTRYISKQKKAGKSKEQIKADLLEMIDTLES